MKQPVLHLNLKRKWFQMIYAGYKDEEYRKISPYWSKIFSDKIKIRGRHYIPHDIIICFSNGYSKNRDQFLANCIGLDIREGRPEWGAIPGEKYFCLHIGKIRINLKNNNQGENNERQKSQRSLPNCWKTL